MRKFMLWRFVAALFALALVAAACSDSDTSADTSNDGEGTETEVMLAQAGEGGLLAEVQARGTLNCGVSGAATAFSVARPDGSEQGFDADYCRAVAAAILGDSNAVNFVVLTAAESFTAVQTGTVDVLIRNTTWTQSPDTDLGLDFGPTTYYDGQQLMARASDDFSPQSGIADIDGAVVCANAETLTAKNIAGAADAAGVLITVETFEDFDIVTDNFINGVCDIITADGLQLVGRKAEQQPEGEEWVIFPPAAISKEPLGPIYGQNDSQFADVVNWTVYVTIIADENGVTSGNVSDMLVDGTAEVIRLLGGEGQLQSAMGLDADAFFNVISQVGNYDEIYSRHMNPVGLSRDGSSNARWNEGGLIYAPPAR